MGLGFEIAVPVVLCTYFGYKADSWLGTAPWLLVVGSMLGIAVAFYNLFRRVGRGQQGSDSERP